MKPATGDLVLNALAELPETCGSVRQADPGRDRRSRFVLIFQDDPANTSLRAAIAAALRHFVAVVKIVGRDGDSGEMDARAVLRRTWDEGSTKMREDARVAHLLSALGDEDRAKLRAQMGPGIDDWIDEHGALGEVSPMLEAQGDVPEDVQEKVLRDFMMESIVAPSEYADAVHGTRFVHVGVEDMALHAAAAPALGAHPVLFAQLEVRRAETIAANLLAEMERRGERRAALVASGNIPILAAEALQAEGIGWAVIDPQITAGSDRARYLRLLRGEKPGDDEVLSDEFGAGRPPEDTATALERRRMQQLMRRKLLHPARFLQAMRAILSPREYRDLERDVEVASGPHGRAVILEAELIERGQAAAARARFPAVQRRLGLLAFTLGIGGAAAGIADSAGWYRGAVLALFGAAALAALLTRAMTPAAAWLVQAAAFVAGRAVAGRWGMAAALVAAFVVTQVVVARAAARRMRKAKALNRVAGSLMREDPGIAELRKRARRRGRPGRPRRRRVPSPSGGLR